MRAGWGLLAALWLGACADADVAGERSLATAEAVRGDVTRVVGATGKIVPRDEIMVGSEVSGRVEEVLVDFNSTVKAGDVLARIDPTNFQSRVRQIQSGIDASLADIAVQQASIESAQVNLANAEKQMARQTGLFQRDAISAAQMEAAERDVGVARANLKLAQARLKSAEASVGRQRAQLAEARADLARTTITSPIDGVVIDRKVDPGQTVQASFSAPELFAIAADLSDIQVEATIVESDVAGLEAGDAARFTVDAYPDDTVEGVVEQLRLKSSESNNIVSYTAVINAPNPDRKLMPGMTANLQIVTDIKSDVPRLPVAAERFRPAPADVAAFEAASEGEAPAGLLDPTFARLETIGLSQARREAFRAMVEPATQRMREVINDPTRSFMHTPMRIAMAEVIDGQLRAFLSPDEQQAYQAEVARERTIRPVELWVATDDGRMRRKTVRLGLSDGNFVEVVRGLEPGERVVVGVNEAPTAPVGG